MKVKIITPWKLKDAELLALEKKYIKRTPWKIDIKEVKSLNDVAISGFLIALDEKGENISTPNLAKRLENKSDVSFIIGEADGLTDELRNKADMILSFGKLTWPHKMARVMLAEQIYRCWSILNNHPYHRE